MIERERERERLRGRKRRQSQGEKDGRLATLRRARGRINYYFRSWWSNICANRKSRRASSLLAVLAPLLPFFARRPLRPNDAGFFTWKCHATRTSCRKDASSLSFSLHLLNRIWEITRLAWTPVPPEFSFEFFSGTLCLSVWVFLLLLLFFFFVI